MGSTVKSVSQFNPATCYSAGQLRGIGCAIPDNIPDCAWVPMASVDGTCTYALDHLGLVLPDMSIKCDVTFHKPFRWIHIDYENVHCPSCGHAFWTENYACQHCGWQGEP